MLTSNFRYGLRSLFGIIFSLSLRSVSQLFLAGAFAALSFFVFADSASACLIPIQTNYWYKLNYEIPAELLPPGIDVSLTYPEHGDGAYHDTLGRVLFTNNSARDLFILPSDAVYQADQFRENMSPYNPYEVFVVSLADALEQNSPETVSVINHSRLTGRLIEAGTSQAASGDSPIARDLRDTMELPQSPGGVKPQPAPYTYELVLLHNAQFYRIPLTISYTLNPHYDETRIASSAPLSDYMIPSDNIVLGKVIGAAPDSQLVDYSHPLNGNTNTYVVGTARIEVEEWIFGEGPDEIYVSSFTQPGFSCGGEIAVGARSYFVLTDSGDEEPANGDIPSFGHSKRNFNREQAASALAKSKGILLDQVMSILMPILYRD